MTLFPEPQHEPQGRQFYESTEDRQLVTTPVRCDHYVETAEGVASDCQRMATWFAGGFNDEAACDYHAPWLRNL